MKGSRRRDWEGRGGVPGSKGGGRLPGSKACDRELKAGKGAGKAGKGGARERETRSVSEWLSGSKVHFEGDQEGGEGG